MTNVTKQCNVKTLHVKGSLQLFSMSLHKVEGFARDLINRMVKIEAAEA